ncbi:MAG: hypothetical protein HY319_10865 [Armatimonadetes bacterium]|nr:hypothetical protein [Armatimonadota bacterium]
MPVCTVSGPPGGATQRHVRGSVDPGLIRTLKELGMELPVRGMCDPRLDYPELLLLHGFEYQLGAEGSRYAFELDSEHYQIIEYAEDARRLVTRCAARAQVLARDEHGRITETWQ